MLGLPSSVRIFLCVTPVDMRRSFDSLAENVRQMLGEDPLSGHLFSSSCKTGQIYLNK
jgi:transposase